MTADRNLQHQQNTSKLRLGIVVLAAGSTKLHDLRLLTADILAGQIGRDQLGRRIRNPAAGRKTCRDPACRSFLEMAPGPGGALTGINPAGITRIEMLKSIGSLSAYGVRGASGVVLISTRRN